MQKEENMQQLGKRNTYTPTGAAPARGNCDLPLNREDNPEERLIREQVEHSILVFVLNKHGKAHMPCTAGKAGRLLKQGKAKVVNRTPFTIQLLDRYLLIGRVIRKCQNLKE